jgi:hypothetical protein
MSGPAAGKSLVFAFQQISVSQGQVCHRFLFEFAEFQHEMITFHCYSLQCYKIILGFQELLFLNFVSCFLDSLSGKNEMYFFFNCRHFCG